MAWLPVRITKLEQLQCSNGAVLWATQAGDMVTDIPGRRGCAILPLRTPSWVGVGPGSKKCSDKKHDSVSRVYKHRLRVAFIKSQAKTMLINPEGAS